MRPGRVVIGLIVILIIVFSSSGAYIYFRDSGLSSWSTGGSCASIIHSGSPFLERGFSHVCGTNTVSDGLLQITVHNYHFALARDIHFENASNQQSPLPDEVFMLVNVSVANIGGGEHFHRGRLSIGRNKRIIIR